MVRMLSVDEGEEEKKEEDTKGEFYLKKRSRSQKACIAAIARVGDWNRTCQCAASVDVQLTHDARLHLLGQCGASRHPIRNLHTPTAMPNHETNTACSRALTRATILVRMG